ncbi:transmembrane protein 237-like [Littorina saxatilis]|uniref:Transmembrane protein 237 n=1 Tax=Littorina saxatilis TaxID=31220 RepID=A0AAN9B4Q9_9CAEN
MADENQTTPKKVTQKKGLPPISPRNNENDDGSKPQVTRRKKKTPAEPVENGHATEDGEKPTPRRRARSATPAGKKEVGGGEEGEDTNVTTPKKKKKKPKAKAEEGEEGLVSDRSAPSVQEDVGGSKTSLIKEDGTPRKKGKKKKVKKAAGGGDTDNFGDSYLAAELQEIKEDIVGIETKEELEEKRQLPFLTSKPILHSQPIDKIFIETNRGFKGYTTAQLTKRAQQEREEKAVIPDQPSRNTMEFGLSTHRVFQTICLFLHGLTAGLGLWQVVVVYILLMNSDRDFLVHYRVLSLPVQCMFYLLFALCSISACDRFDIGNPTRRFVVQALTLQNGAVSIVVYLVGLVLSLSTVDVEDRIHLQNTQPSLWNSTETTSDELFKFTSLNTARGVAAILGWFIIALAPNADRLSKNLHEGDDDILSGELELDQVSPA